MEPKDSLPHSHQLSIRPYLNQMNPDYTHILFFKTSFNIILPFTSKSYIWFLSGYPASILYAFLVSPMSGYMPRPSHPSIFDKPRNISWRVLKAQIEHYQCSQIWFTIQEVLYVDLRFTTVVKIYFDKWMFNRVVSLLINTEKTKYMTMSHHHNSRI
jgi:hypothetical protein